MLSVRQLESTDHAAWLGLWQGYLAFYETVLADELTALAWQRINDPAFNLFGLIAELDGKPVGTTHYLFHHATWSAGEYCYLEDLFVAPAARKHGVGAALIAAVKVAATARKASKLYWITHHHNATARKLYDAVATDSGFVQYQIKL